MKIGDATVRWTTFDYESWQLVIAADQKGLCYVNRDSEPYEEFYQWIAKKAGKALPVRDDDAMKPYVDELAAYMSGELDTFTVPFSYRGTPFQEAVWQALCGIGYGELVAYSDIARRIGKPKAVRAVGAAVGSNPLMIVVPCHRVVGKRGALTGFGGGLDLKTRLLEIEGIGVTEQGYVRYG